MTEEHDVYPPKIRKYGHIYKPSTGNTEYTNENYYIYQNGRQESRTLYTNSNWDLTNEENYSQRGVYEENPYTSNYGHGGRERENFENYRNSRVNGYSTDVHDTLPETTGIYDHGRNSLISRENAPPWIQMLSPDPSKPQTGNRSSFRLPTRIDLKEPIFPVPKDSDSDVSSEQPTPRRVTKTRLILFITICVILIAGVSALSIILTRLSETDKYRYYESSIRLTLDQNYTEDLGNKESDAFKNFSKEFCLSVQDAFVSDNSSYKDSYQGCIVDQLSEGSIVVQFRIIFSIVTMTSINNDTVSAILVQGLATGSSFTVIAISMQVSVSYIQGSSDPLLQVNVLVYVQVLSEQTTTEITSTGLMTTTNMTETTANYSDTTEAITTVETTQITEAITTSATETSQTTEEMTTSVAETTQTTEEMTTSAAETTQTTEGVTTSSTETTQTTEEMTTSVAETTQTTEEMTTSAAETTQTTEDMTASAEDTTQTTEEVTTSSTEKTQTTEEMTTSAAAETTQTTEDMTTSAEDTTQTTEAIATSATETSQTTEEMTTSVAETTQTMREMTTTAAETTQTTEDMTTSAEDTTQTTEGMTTSSTETTQTTEAMTTAAAETTYTTEPTTTTSVADTTQTTKSMSTTSAAETTQTTEDMTTSAAGATQATEPITTTSATGTTQTIESMTTTSSAETTQTTEQITTKSAAETTQITEVIATSATETTQSTEAMTTTAAVQETSQLTDEISTAAEITTLLTTTVTTHLTTEDMSTTTEGQMSTITPEETTQTIGNFSTTTELPAPSSSTTATTLAVGSESSTTDVQMPSTTTIATTITSERTTETGKTTILEVSATTIEAIGEESTSFSTSTTVQSLQTTTEAQTSHHSDETSTVSSSTAQNTEWLTTETTVSALSTEASTGTSTISSTTYSTMGNLTTKAEVPTSSEEMNTTHEVLATSTPEDTTTTPWVLTTSSPGDTTTTSDVMTTSSPEEMTTTPEVVTSSTPGNTTTPEVLASSSPGDTTTTPVVLTTSSPEEMSTTPAVVTSSSPGGMTTTSEVLTTSTPGDATTAPEITTTSTPEEITTTVSSSIASNTEELTKATSMSNITTDLSTETTRETTPVTSTGTTPDTTTGNASVTTDGQTNDTTEMMSTTTEEPLSGSTDTFTPTQNDTTTETISSTTATSNDTATATMSTVTNEPMISTTEILSTTTPLEETTSMATSDPMVTAVSMNTYSQRAPVGGIGSFVCTVSNTNMSGSVVKIKRQLNDTIIATINSSGISIVPGQENKFSAEVSQNGGDIETRFNVTSITCGDEGTYICCLEKGNTTLQSPAFELSVYADPSNVELTVNADFVTDLARAGEQYYHICKGNIGYPSNTSYLGIRLKKSSGDGEFVYSEATTKESERNTNNSNFQWTVKVSENETMYVGSDVITGTCTSTQQIKFLLEIDSSWNNGIIECFIQEWNDQQNVSVSKEINLIPGNYCTGEGNKKKYHPDGCNKWVTCYNDYPYGSSCSDTTLCYDIYNGRDYCENCDQVFCEPEPTTTPMPTTTQYSAAYVTCIDTEASINDSSAVIRCNVTSEAFTIINITHLSQGSSQEVWVASISFNGDVVMNTGIDDVVTFNTANNPKKLNVEVRNIDCTDRGQYIFRTLGAANYSSQNVEFRVKASPGAVTLTVNADLVEGAARAGDRYNHICKGDIGYPTGRAYVGIRLTKSGGGEQFIYSEEATFASDIDKSNPTSWTVSILGTGTLYIAGDETSGTCTLTQEIKYLLQLDSSWDGGTMECFVHDRQSNTDTAVSADIALIPANYCAGETDNAIKSHPGGCNKWVVCYDGHSYGWACTDLSLCYNRDKRYCESCDQVTCGS